MVCIYRHTHTYIERLNRYKHKYIRWISIIRCEAKQKKKHTQHILRTSMAQNGVAEKVSKHTMELMPICAFVWYSHPIAVAFVSFSWLSFSLPISLILFIFMFVSICFFFSLPFCCIPAFRAQSVLRAHTCLRVLAALALWQPPC